MSNPTALDFTALVEDVRQQRRQQQIGILDFIEISSHRLFNLLQTDPWCNKKVSIGTSKYSPYIIIYRHFFPAA